MEMTEEQLRVRVRELAPFHHAVELSARRKTYLPEMSYRTVERTRVDSLMRHGWPQLLEACGGSLRGRRVLDIACNCGGFSVEAIKAGADYVLGVDIVDRYLDQAEFIKQALGYPNLDFRKVDVFDLSPELGGHLRCGSLFWDPVSLGRFHTRNEGHGKPSHTRHAGRRKHDAAQIREPVFSNSFAMEDGRCRGGRKGQPNHESLAGGIFLSIRSNRASGVGHAELPRLQPL